MQRYAIWRMCSGPPRYYNLINRQAGCPQRLPPSLERSPAFLLPVLALLGRLGRGYADLRLDRVPRSTPPLAPAKQTPDIRVVSPINYNALM
jgi:hypothetical protein